MEHVINIYDIYDYYTPPFWQTTWFKVCIGLACLALIAVIMLYILRRKKLITPHEWALHELDNLTSMPLINHADGKRFYFSLTNIIKQYLYKQYQWKIIDKTDEELVLWLKNRNADITITNTMQQVSHNAVWVKFANVEALKTHIDTDIIMVKTMINHTNPSNKKS